MRSRRRSRRAGLLGMAAVCIVSAGLALVLISASPGGSPAALRADSARVKVTTPVTSAKVAVNHPTTSEPATSTTDVGSLPQTGEFPQTSAQFQSEMVALWRGIVSGSTASARPAFFPESAYLQLKDIADPAADYTDRLLADFSADLGAAHALLGPDANTANLIGVDVPEQYGHWIPPGVCDNGVGYYEVANARVVYREDGLVRSFGIASLISWRGQWYVVHLGAILRSGDQGVVEDPEIGPGASPDSTTC